MLPQWIIEKKRDGNELTESEIRDFIDGYTRGELPDYQMAAMAMAIYLKGMNPAEIAVLTDAMMRSGDLVDTSSIDLPKADKHSTGGIGDKVSLPLAPLIACCDVAVPMISGRGLGITGGTLDKLESIPGYRTDLSEKEFIEVIQKCGCSITGQTGRLAPADKKLYALRDVTGTVPSIALITASIMCKKMAEGIDALVLDVKWGKGAFMQTLDSARALARSMIDVGRNMGKKVGALITEMNRPLGRTAGNAVEVIESVEALKGMGPPDLMECTLELGADMLILTGRAATSAEGRAMLQKHIDSGAGYERFLKMVELQGGDVRAIENTDLLPKARIVHAVKAPGAGYIERVDALLVGKACAVLGAGRARTDDAVDFAVGATRLKQEGEAVEKDEALVLLHANSEDRLAEALKLLDGAFAISGSPVTPAPVITERVEVP